MYLCVSDEVSWLVVDSVLNPEMKTFDDFICGSLEIFLLSGIF